LLGLLSKILELLNNILLRVLVEMLELRWLLSCLENLRSLNLLLYLLCILNWCWFWDLFYLLRLFFPSIFLVQAQKAIKILNWSLGWNWGNQL
jgi:hypothetical protein